MCAYKTLIHNQKRSADNQKRPTDLVRIQDIGRFQNEDAGAESAHQLFAAVELSDDCAYLETRQTCETTIGLF